MMRFITNQNGSRIINLEHIVQIVIGESGTTINVEDRNGNMEEIAWYNGMDRCRKAMLEITKLLMSGCTMIIPDKGDE
jgi:hypothetical protein